MFFAIALTSSGSRAVSTGRANCGDGRADKAALWTLWGAYVFAPTTCMIVDDLVLAVCPPLALPPRADYPGAAGAGESSGWRAPRRAAPTDSPPTVRHPRRAASPVCRCASPLARPGDRLPNQRKLPCPVRIAMKIFTSALGVANVDVDGPCGVFIFIVSSYRYQCNRFAADLLSPLIARCHKARPTANCCRLETPDPERLFPEFMSLGHGHEVEVTPTKSAFFSVCASELDNDEINGFLSGHVSENLSEDNVVRNIRLKESTGLSTGPEFAWLAARFTGLPGRVANALRVQEVAQVVWYRLYSRGNEDELLDWIWWMVGEDASYHTLFELVQFAHVSAERAGALMLRVRERGLGVGPGLSAAIRARLTYPLLWEEGSASAMPDPAGPAHLCSCVEHGAAPFVQPHYQCRTCGLVGDLGCREACAKECHVGHDCDRVRTGASIVCDCGAGTGRYVCQVMVAPEPPAPKPPAPEAPAPDEAPGPAVAGHESTLARGRGGGDSPHRRCRDPVLRARSVARVPLSGESQPPRLQLQRESPAVLRARRGLVVQLTDPFEGAALEAALFAKPGRAAVSRQTEALPFDEWQTRGAWATGPMAQGRCRRCGRAGPGSTTTLATRGQLRLPMPHLARPLASVRAQTQRAVRLKRRRRRRTGRSGNRPGFCVAEICHLRHPVIL